MSTRKKSPIPVVIATPIPASNSYYDESEEEESVPCSFFQRGLCNQGANCRFQHVLIEDTRPLCTFFQRGECNQGANCRFQHVLIEDTRPLCTFFQRGECNEGNHCKFRHMDTPKPPGPKSPGPTPPRPPVVPDIDIVDINMNSAARKLAKRIISLEEEETKALSLDMAIVMDCTGSMSSWIDAAKERVRSIIQSVKGNFADKATIRVAFVAYRDFDVPHKRIKTIAFTEDIAAVERFIAGEEAEGGGDTPEDIQGAFQAVLSLNWTANAKLMILVTDAPCHGRKYHDFEDNRSNSKGPTIETQMAEIATRGIGFVMIDICPANTAKMIPFLRDAFNGVLARQESTRQKKRGLTNVITFNVVPFTAKSGAVGRAAELSISSLLTDTLVSAASSTLESSATKSIEATLRNNRINATKKSSISSKMAAMSIHEKLNEDDDEDSDDDEDEDDDLSAYRVRKAGLSWNMLSRIRSEDAIRYTYWFNIIGVDKRLWASDPFAFLVRAEQRTTVKVFPSYFSEGHMRTAHGFKDAHVSQPLVAKVYKKPSQRKLESYARDAQLQTIARGLAKEFSTHPHSLAAIDFISVSFYELLDRHEGDYFKYFAAEPHMTGTYIKYNNNAGWTLSTATAAGARLTPEQEEFGKIAQAFSHFTWEHTKTLLHCVDLQGVDNILTDPQIFSAAGDGKFGKGDLGPIGSAAFFKSHVCNKHCKALGLPVRYQKINQEPIPGSRKGGKTRRAASEVQFCCELYCGRVFTMSREDYLNEEREIYCKPCQDEIKANIELRTCETCGCEFKIKAFWYCMKGMEVPNECSKCKKS